MNQAKYAVRVVYSTSAKPIFTLRYLNPGDDALNGVICEMDDGVAYDIYPTLADAQIAASESNNAAIAHGWVSRYEAVELPADVPACAEIVEKYFRYDGMLTKSTTDTQCGNFIVSIGCPRRLEICNEFGRPAPRGTLMYSTEAQVAKRRRDAAVASGWVFENMWNINN